MSADTDRGETAKADFEPSVLIDYGEVSELTKIGSASRDADSQYLS